MSPKHSDDSFSEILEKEDSDKCPTESLTFRVKSKQAVRLEPQAITSNITTTGAVAIETKLPITSKSNNNSNNLIKKMINDVSKTMINFNFKHKHDNHQHHVKNKQQQQLQQQHQQPLLLTSNEVTEKCKGGDDDITHFIKEEVTTAADVNAEINVSCADGDDGLSTIHTTLHSPVRCALNSTKYNNINKRDHVDSKRNTQSERLTNNSRSSTREVSSICNQQIDVTHIPWESKQLTETAVLNQQGTIVTTTTATTTTSIIKTLVEAYKNSSSLVCENKCTSTSWCQVSDQKVLEVTASLSSPLSSPEELTATDQCEEELRLQSNGIKTLAERKALLKKEFFQDFNAAPKPESVVSRRVLKRAHNLKLNIYPNIPETGTTAIIPNSSESLVAQRKRVLKDKIYKSYKIKEHAQDNSHLFETKRFPPIKELVKKFDTTSGKMLLPQQKVTEESAKEMDALKPENQKQQKQRQSPLSDEGCNIGQSPYSTDGDDDEEDNESVRTTQTIVENPLPLNRKVKEKVSRSGSSDSALGLEVEEAMDAFPPPPEMQQKRRMTLTVTDLPLRPALLPLAEPTLLPDSPTLEVPPLVKPTAPPSKILLEERVVSIPEDPRSGNNSRRESCFSDYSSMQQEMPGVRYVRTPSVVISDYSDDVMCGITLEEIEYFRAQRMRHRRSSLETSNTEKDDNSDVSAASSCSNLYYCGSTISALDGGECLVNGERLELQRKTSNCSSATSLSADEDGFTIPEQPECDKPDLVDRLANQHLSSKRSKKVGGVASMKIPFNRN